GNGDGLDPPPPEYCAYTNIRLPRPFPTGPVPLARMPAPCPVAGAESGVPPSIGASTLHGQKRHQSQPPATNLDGSNSQQWSQHSQHSQVATQDHELIKYRVRVTAIMDGHGGSNSATGSVPASPGALAVALAAQLLPSFLDLLLHLDPRIIGPHTLACLQGDVLNQSYEDTLHHILAHFRDLFNAYLAARRPSNIPTEVLDEAGCTMCLVLRLSPTSIFAVNIGDSSMVAIDPTTDPPSVLNIWPTDAVAHPPCPLQQASRASVRIHCPPSCPADVKHYTPTFTCGSYEDSISKHPSACFDTQTRHLVQHDVTCLDGFLKEKKSAPAGGERLLVAPGTSHRLRLINSVGNLHHHRVGAFVPRTTVYRFATAALPRNTIMLLMSDGVREKIRDTPCMAAVARALAEGPEACEQVIRMWTMNGGIWRPRSPSPAKQQSPSLSPSLSRASSGTATPPVADAEAHQVSRARDSPPRQKHIRASHLAAQLTDLSRGFSPFQNVSPRSAAAVHRLAQVFAAPASPEAEMARLAESLVQLAMLRASVDDLTCLAWRLLDEDEPVRANGEAHGDGYQDMGTGDEVRNGSQLNGNGAGQVGPQVVWWAASATALHHVRLDDELAQSQ
ncbi:hypothetical protein BCR44DRAFT_1422804, partial [Catenaria anguillulae PL171]